MDFFEHQDRARRSTTRLVILFICAVIAILAALNLAAYGVGRAIDMSRKEDEILRFPGGHAPPAPMPLWESPSLYQFVTIGTLITIASGSLYKFAQLSRGGAAVAQLLGGTPLVPNATSPADTQLQNIVEEMSIASGVPVPQIYVLRDEQGINAFAAGRTPHDAVIGVTQGTLDRLSRDELQGVIAHEFSHILNGDMRLNLRLIAILHGILLLALIGFFVLRSTAYSRSSSSRSDRDGGGGIILMLLIGVALVIIGYVGVFFGRLIQAAVSRQREFLADASAVQFTRNPAGIAGALKKIAQVGSGSEVNNAQALGTAHIFFASAFRVGFTNLLATHPPLIERIKAIEPNWDGSLALGAGATEVLDETSSAMRGNMLASMLANTAGVASTVRARPQQVIERAGTITSPQVRFASELVAAIPSVLYDAAHDPFSARALVMALVTNDEPDVRDKQGSIVQITADAPTLREYLRLLEQVDAFHAARLPLLNLSLGALRQLSPQQAKSFLPLVRSLIEADQRVTLFEFALYRILEKQLTPPDQATRQPLRYLSVSAVREDVAILLTALSGESSSNPQQAFDAGAAALEVDPPITRNEAATITAVDQALHRLSQASPPVKRRIISAAAATVSADGEMNVAEAELLRAACATLGVPIPVFLTEPASAEKLR